jgi:succinate dehydrogenase / fumarate reductase membrane anchor subunit
VSAPTAERPAEFPEGGTRGQPVSPRPRPNFETWSWFFMRISGLALLFLALTHFALTHIVNDVVETDHRFVAERWDNPLWRLFDWALLFLALLHGLNGLRWIIDDYVRTPARRAAVKAVLYSVSFGLLGLGTLTIVTFEG